MMDRSDLIVAKQKLEHAKSLIDSLLVELSGPELSNYGARGAMATLPGIRNLVNAAYYSWETSHY